MKRTIGRVADGDSPGLANAEVAALRVSCRTLAAAAGVLLLASLLVSCSTPPIKRPTAAPSPSYVLLRASTSISGTALLTGRLGADVNGCVTVAGVVLIAGTAAALDAAGGLTLGERHFAQGDMLSISGGTASAPADSPCAPRATYWQ